MSIGMAASTAAARASGRQVGWTPGAWETLRPQTRHRVRLWEWSQAVGTSPCKEPARFASMWDFIVATVAQPPGPSWVRARTCWNRAKHPLSLRLSRRRPFPPSRCARERGSRILGFTNAHPAVRPPGPGLTPLLMVTGPPTVPADRRRVRTPRQQRVPNNRRWQFLPLVVQCFRDSEPLTAAEGGRKLAGAWQC